MTKDELKAAVDSYLHRVTDVADFDLFLLQAEADIVQQVRAFESRAGLALTEAERTSSGGYTLPADFSEMLSVGGLDGSDIRPASRIEYGQAKQSGGGTPWVYTIGPAVVTLQPNPPEDFTFQIIYWTKPAALAAGSDTNTLITNHPSLYIYSCAMYAYDWARNYEQREAASNRFVAKVEEINAIDERRRYGPSVSVGNDQPYGSWSRTNGGM